MKRIAVIVTVAAVAPAAAASSASAQVVSASESLRPAMICDCGGSPWPPLIVRLMQRAQHASKNR